jgi:hypothetical protein
MAKDFSGNYLYLRDGILVVSIDERAMIIDLAKQIHYTLGPESGCAVMHLLSQNRGEEVHFDEVQECIMRHYAVKQDELKPALNKFLTDLEAKGFLKTLPGERKARAIKKGDKRFKNFPELKKKKTWKEVSSLSKSGSWSWGNIPPIYEPQSFSPN